mmetsp:Transcript_33626/g.52322  ORF Transcript_33626/g.52322 Transcript_33626/m.52322 type:complete len:486 (+) Transcript_33626:1-1458(+)
MLFIQSPLKRDQLHTVSFQVTNPREGAQPPGSLTLAARGAVVIEATEIDRTSNGARGGQGTEGQGGEALRVLAPRFLTAKIRQSDPRPGAINTLTITFSLTIALEGERGQRIIVSGLTGSQTLDTEELALKDVGASGVEEVLGSQARWRRVPGVLEIGVIGASVPGAVYSFSFELLNPSAAQRAPEVHIAAPGTRARGRRMELDVQGGQGVPGVQEVSRIKGFMEESEARLPEDGKGWYETYASHLRTQYPDLFGVGVQGAKGGGKVTQGVLIGLSADFRITCSRDGARELRVRWNRLGASRLAEQAPIFILQVAAEGPSSKLFQGYRTVYAGPETSCVVPLVLAPPGMKIRIRLREEVWGNGGKLLTSPWSTIHDLEPEKAVTGVAEPLQLLWSSQAFGYGIRLSAGRHAMRRDDYPGWAGALCEAGATAGRLSFRCSFMGRAEVSLSSQTHLELRQLETRNQTCWHQHPVAVTRQAHKTLPRK